MKVFCAKKREYNQFVHLFCSVEAEWMIFTLRWTTKKRQKQCEKKRSDTNEIKQNKREKNSTYTCD